MSTSIADSVDQVQAASVRFNHNSLIVQLNDNREVSVQIDEFEWLKWLADATPKQRDNWSIEPGGYAVYWDELDNGLEVCHLLGMQPMT